MYMEKMRGFTLIEILTVICIIVLLIGLLSPALRKAREQANIQKAKAMISSLEVAVNMYYTDIGSYPAALSDLMDTTNPRAPYMDNKDYVAPDFLDPWRNVYNYQQPGTHNTSTFDLSSNGPDTSDPVDDITNW